jgi:hypothetical protein
MDLLLVVLVVLAVALAVSAPLRWDGAEPEPEEDAQLADLQAAKEAKYLEIRDAELDYRTGKLSAEDHRTLDRGLRAEAVELLRRIDRVRSARGDVG